MKNKKKLGILVLIGSILIIGSYFIYYIIHIFYSRLNHDTFFIVNKNETIKRITDRLYKNGIIKNKIIFLVILKLKGDTIKYGEYKFDKGTKLLKIIDKLLKGDIYKYKITIPEGYTVNQIANLLSEKGLINKSRFLYLTKNPQVIKKTYKYIPTDSHLEGYLFPDTYYIEKFLDEEIIIDRMLKRFQEMLPRNIEEREKELKLSLNEIIILSSLVEKEAVKDNERRLIAGVLLNRLRKGMLLQCDATVQYALGLDKYRRLIYDDLDYPSPYNTYLHPGLPPTPICNPGVASIKAALYPAQTNYLYYVAKDDRSHIFSRTYNEHLNAIKLVRRNK